MPVQTAIPVQIVYSAGRVHVIVCALRCRRDIDPETGAPVRAQAGVLRDLWSDVLKAEEQRAQVPLLSLV